MNPLRVIYLLLRGKRVYFRTASGRGKVAAQYSRAVSFMFQELAMKLPDEVNTFECCVVHVDSDRPFVSFDDQD